MERPVLRCLAVRVLPGGSLSRTRIVSLGEAYLLWQSGQYAIVGPDPEDEEALAVWEREQEAAETARREFVNRPRWWR